MTDGVWQLPISLAKCLLAVLLFFSALCVGSNDALAADQTINVPATYKYPGGSFATAIAAADALDTYLKAIAANTGGTTTIEFPAGEFYTRGRYNSQGLPPTTFGFLLKTGWKIKGSKSGSTLQSTLLLASALVDTILVQAENCILSSTSVGDQSNISVEDILLDCNYSGVSAQVSCPNLKLTAINIYGTTDFLVRNVRVVNAASRRAPTDEAFPTWIGGSRTSGRPGNVTVENCVFSDYQKGYCSAITIAYNLTGYVRNNQVIFPAYDPNLSGGLRYNQNHFGLNATGGNPGTQSLHFTANYVEGAVRGLNLDTASNHDTRIAGNQFWYCLQGVYLVNAVDGICEDNFILLPDIPGVNQSGISIAKYDGNGD